MNAATNNRHVLWVLALLTALATMILACRVTPSPEPTLSPKPMKPVPSLPKQTEKLSPRLQLLASPDLSQQSAEEQARALGLPASGPGSLMRNENGEVLVYIRLNSPESDLAALVEAGATIVHTAEDALTVTAYIHPTKLDELGKLDQVLNVREEIRPK
jgi:hypothetical protein